MVRLQAVNHGQVISGLMFDNFPFYNSTFTTLSYSQTKMSRSGRTRMEPTNGVSIDPPVISFFVILLLISDTPLHSTRPASRGRYEKSKFKWFDCTFIINDLEEYGN
jgi:hypothetical protein